MLTPYLLFHILLFSFAVVMLLRAVARRNWNAMAAYMILAGGSWIAVCCGLIDNRLDFGIGAGVEWMLFGGN